MKNFHDFYYSLPISEREALAKKVGTSVFYLQRLAGGFALPSLRKAQQIVRASGGRATLEQFVASYEKRNGRI